MPPRVGIYCPRLAPAPGGLPDHTAALAVALAELGIGGAIMGLTGSPDPPPGWDALTGIEAEPGPHGFTAAARARGLDAVTVQYVPFMYARRGLSPALVLGMRELRRSGVRAAVYLHEPYVPFTRLPWLLTGWPMRWQFRSVVRNAHAVVTPVPRFLALARAVAGPGTSFAIAPVGSTIPIAPLSRLEARDRLGLQQGATVVGVFSPAASGYQSGWVVAAAAALRDAGTGVAWVLFGNGSANLAAQLASHQVHDLGRLTAADAGAAFRALDLAVAPFSDGLTLRRTSALAAMANGVALASSTGPLFDPQVAGAASCSADQESFVEAVLTLVREPARRAALAERGRRFHDSEGSVLVGARRLAGLLGWSAT